MENPKSDQDKASQEGLHEAGLRPVSIVKRSECNRACFVKVPTGGSCGGCGGRTEFIAHFQQRHCREEENKAELVWLPPAPSPHVAISQPVPVQEQEQACKYHSARAFVQPGIMDRTTESDLGQAAEHSAVLFFRGRQYSKKLEDYECMYL